MTSPMALAFPRTGIHHAGPGFILFFFLLTILLFRTRTRRYSPSWGHRRDPLSSDFQDIFDLTRDILDRRLFSRFTGYFKRGHQTIPSRRGPPFLEIQFVIAPCVLVEEVLLGSLTSLHARGSCLFTRPGLGLDSACRISLVNKLYVFN